jgi:hypothetical protein
MTKFCSKIDFRLLLLFNLLCRSLQEVIAKLRAAHAQPLLAVVPTTDPTTAPAGKTASEKKAPKCPIHNIPMKASKKRGQSWFCPKQNGDGSYCEEYE